MSPIVYGIVAGVVFGGLAVAAMVPMQFDDARQAYLGAFLSRFSIGFLIPLVTLPMPMWGTGLLVGLLVSLSDAVVTGAYVPILVMGTLGGGLVGLIGGFVLG